MATNKKDVNRNGKFYFDKNLNKTEISKHFAYASCRLRKVRLSAVAIVVMVFINEAFVFTFRMADHESNHSYVEEENVNNIFCPIPT